MERNTRKPATLLVRDRMNAVQNNGQSNEEKFIKCYMDLTGGTESQARAVFIHVCCKDEENSDGADGLKTLQANQPIRRAAGETDSFAREKLAEAMRMFPSLVPQT